MLNNILICFKLAWFWFHFAETRRSELVLYMKWVRKYGNTGICWVWKYSSNQKCWEWCCKGVITAWNSGSVHRSDLLEHMDQRLGKLMQYEVVGCIVQTDIQLSLYDLLTCMACGDTHRHHHQSSNNQRVDLATHKTKSQIKKITTQ